MPQQKTCKMADDNNCHTVEEEKNTYTSQHPFQQVLHTIRTQPDLGYVFELKRALECGAPQFDMQSIPDSGFVVVVGDSGNRNNKLLMFLSHLLHVKKNHLAFALHQDCEGLLPPFWCKKSTLSSMLEHRNRTLPMCVILDVDFRNDEHRRLIFNGRFLKVLLIAVVKTPRMPPAYRANVDVTVTINGPHELTRVDTRKREQHPHAQTTFYYISPYTIALERHRRDQATQVQIYKASK
jgi:hypothetical protein